MTTRRQHVLAHLAAGTGAFGAVGGLAAACKSDSEPAKSQAPPRIVILAESTPGRVARAQEVARQLGGAVSAPLVNDVPGAPAPPGRPAPAAQFIAALAADPAVGQLVWQDHLD